jgi:hypothetical protein
MRGSTARKPKAGKKVASETKSKKEAPVPEASAAVDAPRFPLFYKAPRPVEAAEHANSMMIEDMDLVFATEANAIPINVVEFGVASCHYPIVFLTDEPSLPVVVTGFDPVLMHSSPPTTPARANFTSPPMCAVIRSS